MSNLSAERIREVLACSHQWMPHPDTGVIYCVCCHLKRTEIEAHLQRTEIEALQHTNQRNERSNWAMDAGRAIQHELDGWSNRLKYIQAAIDQACAEKDAEIKRLNNRIGDYTDERAVLIENSKKAVLALIEKDAEIARLQAKLEMCQWEAK